MRMKFALALISACASITTANAKLICPFTDHFIISAPMPVTVLHAATEGNLDFNLINPGYFRLSCADNRSGNPGDLKIEIGMSDDIKCSLTIHDGPREMNPSVTQINCGGPGGRMSYAGMDHPKGSYDYTLKFTM